jgi:hypothetical protein
MLWRLALTFSLTIILLPFCQAYVYESDECVSSVVEVDSCNAYPECVTKSVTYQSTCSKQECAKTEYYPCGETVCETKEYECNCECSETEQQLFLENCHPEKYCKTVDNCCKFLFWDVCNGLLCGTTEHCEEITYCDAVWKEACVQITCDTCEEKTCNQDGSVCSECVEEKTVLYACEKTEQFNLATITDCENKNVIISDLKFCKGVPCSEQTELVEGEEYYLRFQVEKAYHQGKADITISINNETFQFGSDSYETITGAFVFTAGQVENFVFVITDNLDGDVSTASISVNLIPSTQEIITTPFIPLKGGEEELETIIAKNHFFGTGINTLLSLSILSFAAVSLALLLAKTDAVQKVLKGWYYKVSAAWNAFKLGVQDFLDRPVEVLQGLASQFLGIAKTLLEDPASLVSAYFSALLSEPFDTLAKTAVFSGGLILLFSGGSIPLITLACALSGSGALIIFLQESFGFAGAENDSELFLDAASDVNDLIWIGSGALTALQSAKLLEIAKVDSQFSGTVSELNEAFAGWGDTPSAMIIFDDGKTVFAYATDHPDWIKHSKTLTVHELLGESGVEKGFIKLPAWIAENEIYSEIAVDSVIARFAGKDALIKAGHDWWKGLPYKFNGNLITKELVDKIVSEVEVSQVYSDLWSKITAGILISDEVEDVPK